MNITNPIPMQFSSTYTLNLSSNPHTLFVLKIIISNPTVAQTITFYNQNWIKVPRQDIRDYLNTSMYNKTGNTTRYRKRYSGLNKQFKVHMIKNLQHSRDHLNKNYLTYVSIVLLKNKKIKYSKALKSFVKKQIHGKYVVEWTS